MNRKIRVVSLILTLCMLFSLSTAVTAADLTPITHTIKTGQQVQLLTDIATLKQYEISVSESHTSGGSGLEAEVILSPEDDTQKVVVLVGQIPEPGTYKYTVTASYRDSFGQQISKTQKVTVVAEQGYADVVVTDETNDNVDFYNTYEHNLPGNVVIDSERPNTLSRFGLTASLNKDFLTISGTTAGTGTATITLSGVDEDGFTNYYTVRIVISSLEALASTVTRTAKVGETVNYQIVHGLDGTPVRDTDMPNTLADYGLSATPGQNMMMLTGTPIKPGTAEISFTDGVDRMTLKITITGTDLRTDISFLELTGLEVPVEEEMPTTFMKIDHRALAVAMVQWTYVKDGEDVNWNREKPFDRDEKYACYITVNALTGYNFTDEVLVYCGDIVAEDVVVNEEHSSLTACFYFGYPQEPAILIEKVRLEDIEFPTAGTTVGESEDAIKSDIFVSGKSVLEYVTWSEEDKSDTLARRTAFTGGKTYTCRFVLSCPEGYEFSVNSKGKPDVNVSVNEDDNVTLSMDGKNLVVRYNVTVEIPFNPVITYTPAEISCETGDKRTITAQHNFSDDFEVSYQWFYTPTGSKDDAKALPGADDKSLTVPTNIGGVNYYYCIVTGISGTKQYVSGGETMVCVTVETAYVFPFTDVPASQWYRSSVEGAHQMGLINGKTETLYKPDDNMKLVEAIKLAACMNQLHYSGKVLLENGTPWYKPYVDYAKENGIITRDYTETELNASVTRALYVDIFARALPDDALPAINDIPDDAIPDVTSASTYGPAIYKLYRAGILNGSDAKGTFGPSANIKRSAVAAILLRMMDADYRVGAPAELGQ